MPANALGQFGVVGEQGWFHLAVVEEPVQELPLRFVQREERREAFPAPDDQAVHPHFSGLDACQSVSSQRGDQLAANLCRSGPHVAHGHRAPVSAVDRSVDDERYAEPVALQVAFGEQPVRVVKVPARTSSQERRELAGCQFVNVDERDARNLERSDEPGVLGTGRPEWHAEHVVQVDLEIAALSECALVAESPPAARMVGGNPRHREAFASEDGAQGFFELRPLGDHLVARRGADVVQIEVHGQTGHLEQEQVQRRSALERQPSSQEGVRLDRPEKL